MYYCILYIFILYIYSCVIVIISMSLFQDLNLVTRNNPPIVDAFFGRLEFSGSLVRSSKGCGCMLDRSGNSSNSSIWRCFEFRETLGRRTPGLTGSLLDLPFESMKNIYESFKLWTICVGSDNS